MPLCIISFLFIVYLNVVDVNNNNNVEFSYTEEKDITRKININTADKDELILIRGIGENTADKIIEYRENRQFIQIEDIMNIKGIKEGIFNKIRDYITVK